MKFKIEAFREACRVVLRAVDGNEISDITTSLELLTVGNTLEMNVTNKEYFATVKFNLDTAEELHAVVDAKTFVNLVNKSTTSDIELSVADNVLVVKTNGTYKIPMKYEGDELLVLPKINITNPTVNFKLSRTIMDNIQKHNAKEFNKGTIQSASQKYYYVDEKGCITFTTGACVNSFTLPQPVKMMLQQKLVNLFKLFNTDVDFTLGYDTTATGLTLCKAKFETANVILTSLLPNDDSLIARVPASLIRNTAEKDYNYKVAMSKDALFDAIERLLLFSDKTTLKYYSTMEFGKDSVKIWDTNKYNYEVVEYVGTSNIDETYTLIVDFKDLETTLVTWNDPTVTVKLNDGTHNAIVLYQQGISTVVPECSEI